MLPKVYQLPVKTKTVDIKDTPKPSLAENPENLSGAIDGMKASDFEERLARAFWKYGVVFYFRIPIGDMGRPGWKELDFLAFFPNEVYAIQVDDVEFIHVGTQLEKDKITDIIIIEKLKYYGITEITHIPGTRLATQEQAYNVVREMMR